MLKISIPDYEGFDELKQEFVEVKGADLVLEHSLVSISKWESKWKKPFLSKNDRTQEEIIDYIKCMTLTQNVRNEVYKYIPNNVLKQVTDYIEDPMTATTIYEYGRKNSGKQETVTSELIYYWMIALNIPYKFEKWHINRLLTLIKVCNIKNDPKGNQMSMKDTMKYNKALNDARRAQLHSKG